MSKRMDRLGETLKNNVGSTMIIVDYRGALDIDVWFSEYDWTAEGVRYKDFQNGKIACPYERRVYNVGYIGEGEYKVTINGKPTKEYQVWHSMLRRCYNPEYQEKYPTYIGCSVVEEWHNFQNFAEWYKENYYQIGDEVMALDKDILFKHNKIYSPDTCIFVPTTINSLFVKCNASRGNLPVGVSFNKKTNKYVAYCRINDKKVTLGYYNEIKQAFEVYKVAKEQEIKRIAEEYKEQIPNNLYQAMMNWVVEIED